MRIIMGRFSARRLVALRERKILGNSGKWEQARYVHASHGFVPVE